MAAARFRACVAVYGILTEGGRVLLMRRAGSGYRDGQLGLPSGHLDGDEDALQGLRRELREELAVTVVPGRCELGSVSHRRREQPGDDEFIDLFFTVAGWAGVPVIAEPAKCTELVWADPLRLPADTIGYVAAALHAARAGRHLVSFGWEP